MKIMSLGMESCALAKRMDFLVNLLFFKHLVKCLALYRVLFSENAVQERINTFYHGKLFSINAILVSVTINCAAFDISPLDKLSFYY